MSLIFVKIKRQDFPDSSPYWEEFKIPEAQGMTVISLLRYIQKKPVNARGDRVSPVVWESSCLEEVCGSCTMIVNGMAKMACSTFAQNLSQPVVLEPLGKFTVVRDLVVHRKKNSGRRASLLGVPFDGTQNYPSPKDYKEEDRAALGRLAVCINCDACLEACPQLNARSDFVGAKVINEMRLLNFHPVGFLIKEERLKELMDKGGIDDCENVGNCAKVCPKNIPLLDSIFEMKRSVVRQALKNVF